MTQQEVAVLWEAVDQLNALTGKIAAHYHLGQGEAEDLLDEAEGVAREVRNLLEGLLG